MVAAFALINGGVMSKNGYYMPWYVFGGALVMIGSALMCKCHAPPDVKILMIPETL